MHAKRTYYDTNIASVVIQRVPVWYGVCGFSILLPLRLCFASLLHILLLHTSNDPTRPPPVCRELRSKPNQVKYLRNGFFFFPFTFLTWRFFVKYTCVSYMCFRHREYEGRRRGRGRRKLNPSTLRCGFVVEFSIRLT